MTKYLLGNCLPSLVRHELSEFVLPGRRARGGAHDGTLVYIESGHHFWVMKLSTSGNQLSTLLTFLPTSLSTSRGSQERTSVWGWPPQSQ